MIVKYRILLTLAFLTLQTVQIKGQAFTPYLDSTSTWYEHQGVADIMFIYSNHHKFYLNGDTSVSGMTYYKVYYDAIDSTWNWQTQTFVGTATYDFIYVGGIREDSLKRFYFIYNNQTTDTLLFDFNLITGDTIPQEMYSACNILNQTILAIDTVFLGVQPLKKMYVPSFSGNKAMYEGIGGTGGLVWNGSLCEGIEGGSCLIAYKKGSDSLYINCGLNSTGLENFQSRDIFEVFPNPASGIINIRFDSKKPAYLKIYNYQGILEKTLKVSSTDVVQLNIENWHRGFYLLKLISETEILYSGKLVVIP